MSSGAMQSNVGNPQVYNSNDQKTSKQTKNEKTFGDDPSHKVTDSKDQRTIANRLAAAEEQQSSKREHDEHVDPRQPALSHGNEPSKGAKIDASIEADEQEYLRNKGKA